MKKAMGFRVIVLSFIVLFGLFANFYMNMSNVHTYNKINDAWISSKEHLERVTRYEARNMLQQGKYCINKIMSDDSIYKGTFDEKLFYAIDTCMKKAKTSQTGDSFAFRTSDYLFIYDPSLDCFVSGGKKFYDRVNSDNIKWAVETWETTTKKEKCQQLMLGEECLDDSYTLIKPEYPECYLHQNVEMCFTARQALTSGYDSKEGNDIGWRFDDAEEWLEWIVLPIEDMGWNGIGRGNGTIKPNQTILALGIQSDEIEKYCNLDKDFEKIFNSIYEDSNKVSLFIKLLIGICIVYILLTSMVDYRVHKHIVCPYDEVSCPNYLKGEKDVESK